MEQLGGVMSYESQAAAAKQAAPFQKTVFNANIIRYRMQLDASAVNALKGSCSEETWPVVDNAKAFRSGQD